MEKVSRGNSNFYGFVHGSIFFVESRIDCPKCSKGEFHQQSELRGTPKILLYGQTDTYTT